MIRKVSSHQIKIIIMDDLDLTMDYYKTTIQKRKEKKNNREICPSDSYKLRVVSIYNHYSCL